MAPALRTTAASLPLGSMRPCSRSSTVSVSPVCRDAVVPMVAAAARDTTTVSFSNSGCSRAYSSTTLAVTILVMLAMPRRSMCLLPARGAPVEPSATTHASALTYGVRVRDGTLAQATGASLRARVVGQWRGWYELCVL
jgi:hypothetical protein